MMQMLKNLKKLEKDDLLEKVGLQSRRSTMDSVLPALGIFALGVAVGAGIGLMLAPKSGAELRNDLRARLPHRGNDTGYGDANVERASKSA
jgi:hypothetical protein